MFDYPTINLTNLNYKKRDNDEFHLHHSYFKFKAVLKTGFMVWLYGMQKTGK